MSFSKGSEWEERKEERVSKAGQIQLASFSLQIWKDWDFLKLSY